MIAKPILLLLPFLALLLPFASSDGQDFTIWYKYVPIYNVWDPKVRDLASWAVEQYDQKGESHLYFIDVVNGTYYNYYLPKGYMTTWLFWVKAQNCSHPGPPEVYETQVVEELMMTYDATGNMVPSTWNTFNYLKLVYT